MTDHEIVTSFCELLERQGFRLIPPRFAATLPEPDVDAAGALVQVPAMVFTVERPPQIVPIEGALPGYDALQPILAGIRDHRLDRGWGMPEDIQAQLRR